MLDNLGAALCDLAPRHLPTGVTQREGRPALFVPVVDYDCLADAMFHMIRQNASGSAAVLIRIIEVLTAVASVERNPARLRTLQRHADLMLADAEQGLSSASDLAELRLRHAVFVAMRETGREFPLQDERGSP